MAPGKKETLISWTLSADDPVNHGDGNCSRYCKKYYVCILKYLIHTNLTGTDVLYAPNYWY
jgi:hypothetical protein